MKKLVFLTLCLLISFSANAKKKSEFTKVPAGSNVTSLGMALDASYDPKLDDLVRGYKIVTVAITNNSIDILQMDAENDVWWVVDIKGSKHKAVIDIRKKSPKLYQELPTKLRNLITYPIMIQVGETKAIDLFIPKNVNLDGFNSVRFKNEDTGKAFEIVTRE